MLLISIIPIIIIIVVLIKENKDYKSSTYYQITKLPYFSVKYNAGRYGEYLTYKYLKYFETIGAKFLFNIYIPKKNGETTEIDVLMICPKGLFVFESKNYSGWIFGSEAQKNWYQTLQSGRGRSHKESFYNPIMQNNSHIKYLKAFLNEEIPTYSIITFSNRCTLKSIQIESNNVNVIKRYDVAPVVSQICNQISNDLLDEAEVINIYDKLFPYTQVDYVTKAQHVASVHMRQAESFKKSSSGEPPFLRCPQCNGKLILRTATKGTNAGKQFYGCSNYPKCRYIKNIP